jgi:hypothetical protein
MEVLCGKKPVASLKLRREEVKSGEYVDKAKQFCAKITDEILRRRI